MQIIDAVKRTHAWKEEKWLGQSDAIGCVALSAFDILSPMFKHTADKGYHHSCWNRVQ